MSATGIIFTCEEVRSGRRWKYVCRAWGEVIASGPASTQAEARQKNREAKKTYWADLVARQVIPPNGFHNSQGNPASAVQVRTDTEFEGRVGRLPASFPPENATQVSP